MTLFRKLKRLLGHKKLETHYELPWRFESRLREEELIGLAERSLGRQLRKGELNAIWLGFRPQGLLDAEDSYCFSLFPGRHKGSSVPLIEVYPVALSGYVNGSSALVLSEGADIFYRDRYGETHCDTVIS